MRILSPVLFSLSIILTSCSTMQSSYHYTMGTQCLQNDDPQGAIINLKKAVELDPEIARNHTNLSMAYSLEGEDYLAWVHARKAVLAPYPDVSGTLNFALISERMIVTKGLDQAGTSLEIIREALGEPDDIYTVNSTTQYLYGLCLMKFEEKKLVSCLYISPKMN